MKKHALLIRGINVGTKNSLPMAKLRAMLGRIGCQDVATYVQSGNAVFRTSLGAKALTAAIEAALEKEMGRPIATTLRDLASLHAIVAGNPFAKVADKPSNLCVTFLSEVPKSGQLALLDQGDFGAELFRASGKEIYTWHPNGQGTSLLAKALDKLPLTGAVTRRNWNTVLKLVEMLERLHA
jgi:uncharacterized protein (DUF1697 family)